MEQQIHLGEQVRKRLGFNAVQGAALELLEILGFLVLLFQMLKGLNQEAAGSGGGVKNRFT
jgi:hypothetical protein